MSDTTPTRDEWVIRNNADEEVGTASTQLEGLQLMHLYGVDHPDEQPLEVYPRT